MRLMLLTLAAGVAVLAACGGGKQRDVTTAARELRDPRTVPTATVPAQIPTPIPAVLAGQQPSRPTPLPDVYVVKAGDTPAGIAAELGVDVGELLRLNGIDDPRSLRVGQQLRVPRPQPTPAAGRAAAPAPGASRPGSTGTPTPTRTPIAASTARTPTSAAGDTYTVRAGDTACEIAQRLGVPLTALAEANNTTVSALASLQIGQVLKVPAVRGPAGC
jgi:LysM repeat protein